MKKLVLGTLGLLALAAPAVAADLPVAKAPPVGMPVYDWTGFYIGGNVGWGQVYSLPTDLPTPDGLVEKVLPIPTDRSTGGSEVEPWLKIASENPKVPSTPEVEDLVATGRAHLGPKEEPDEKPTKVQ